MTSLLAIIIVLLCCKQEHRGRALCGILAVAFIAKYILPLGAVAFHWLSTGDAPINPLWLFLVVFLIVVGVLMVKAQRVQHHFFPPPKRVNNS